MKLEKKKALVARSLNVGKGRIVFNTARLSEIKEAITKQDIKDLQAQGAIFVKEKKGRRKKQVKKTRRRAGSIKKKVRQKKRKYVTLTRKLRKHLAGLKKGSLPREESTKLRKEIRTGSFKSLANMKERIAQMKEKK